MADTVEKAPKATKAKATKAPKATKASKAKKTGEKKTGEKLTVTLVVSPIGFNKTQAATVQGLGLRRLRHSVEVLDTPATRGMIHKVRHLVKVG
jgi:large subunit ribosomal protein L30